MSAPAVRIDLQIGAVCSTGKKSADEQVELNKSGQRIATSKMDGSERPSAKPHAQGADASAQISENRHKEK
jgi:hypothetical protein